LNLGEEHRSAPGQRGANGRRLLGLDGDHRARQEGLVVRQIQRNSAVIAADRLDAGPHDFSAATQSIQITSNHAAHARGQDVVQ